MIRISSAAAEIGALDLLAGGDSAIHRLDPRTKVLTTLVFILSLVSFGPYVFSALIPFALYPVVLLAVAGLPPGPLLRKLLLAAPFAVIIGLFNPFFDHSIQGSIAGMTLTGGWLSFASLLLRFSLCVTAMLVLVATTGFTGLCLALEKLGVPRVLVLQLLFLHRYLFVLLDEGGRLVRARELRAGGNRGRDLRIFSQLVGQLLLRTLDRARRIHQAMLCRGFDGEVRLRRTLHFGNREIIFLLGWSLLFLLLRHYNLPHIIGTLSERLWS